MAKPKERKCAGYKCHKELKEDEHFLCEDCRPRLIKITHKYNERTKI